MILLLFSVSSCTSEKVVVDYDYDNACVTISSKRREELKKKATYVIYANVVSKEVYDDYITLTIDNIKNLNTNEFNGTSIDVYYKNYSNISYYNITNTGFALGDTTYGRIPGEVTYDNVIKDKIKVYFYSIYNSNTKRCVLIDDLNALFIEDDDAINYAKTYYNITNFQ